MAVMRTLGKVNIIRLKIKAITSFITGGIFLILGIGLAIGFKSIYALIGGIVGGGLALLAGFLWWKRASHVNQIIKKEV